MQIYLTGKETFPTFAYPVSDISSRLPALLFNPSDRDLRQACAELSSDFLTME